MLTLKLYSIFINSMNFFITTFIGRVALLAGIIGLVWIVNAIQ